MSENETPGSAQDVARAHLRAALASLERAMEECVEAGLNPLIEMAQQGLPIPGMMPELDPYGRPLAPD